jgi:hypothetical protein
MNSPTLMLFMLACGGSEPREPKDTETATGPYIIEAPELTPPDTNDATLAAGIEESILAILSFDFAPIEVGYTTAMAGQDAACPVWATDGETDFWFATCTSEDGTSFEGFGAVVDYADLPPEDGITYAGTFLNSISTITTPSGETFSGGGQAFDISGSNDDGYEFNYFGVSEGYLWTGDDAEGTWMESTPILDFVGNTQRSGAYRTIELSGSISDLGSVQAVVFDGLYGLNVDLPDGCSREPFGNIAVLDPDGNWFDLQFNGPDSEGRLDPEIGCDGCGTAWLRGHPLFEVCPNFDEMYAWDD